MDQDTTGKERDNKFSLLLLHLGNAFLLSYDALRL